MLLLARFTIRGHSMEPTLKEGNVVFVSNIPYWFREPRINDIALFYNTTTNKTFVKRITKSKNDRYLLIGDNPHDSLDSRKLGWIERKDIAGKVIYVIKS